MKIDFLTPDAMFLTGALLALAAGAMLWQRQKKKIVVWWRLVIAGLLLLLLLQPSSIRLSGNARPLVAVACDVSPSMFLSGRADAVRGFIARITGGLAKAWDVRFYRFAGDAESIGDAADITAARPRSPTDIRRSLWQIRRDAGERLAGIILFSDFNHNADATDPHWAGELNVPVFPVAAGTRKQIRDVSIESVRVSDFAFKNMPVDIVVQVGLHGLSDAVVTLNLKNAATGATLASKRTQASGANESRDATLRYTPDANGRLNLAVEAEPLDGEVTRTNNRKEFSLDIVRDKLRVLYLCGQPGPEYAFLRHTLKNDPAVELVSFVILRNPENIALVPDNDLSLIPFPVNTLFTRDLYDFDALILENFTYQRFGFMPEYLQNIKSWVTDKGGGLIMIGGMNSFGAGGWGGTPVEEVLPVLLEKPQDHFEEGLFRPVVDDPGHFIMAINDDRARNEALWKSVPELDGCQALKARPGAEVLARHPWKNVAVLCAWERGKGRVVALGANTTWRWALGSSSPEMYTRFWKNVIRYLTRSGQSRQIQMMFDRAEYASGQSFALKIRGIERYAGHTMRVTMIEPSGKRAALSAARDGDKEWLCRGTLGDAGAYRFEAGLEKNGVPAGFDEASLNVVPALYSEESLLDINEPLARAIAGDSGGAYFAAETFDPVKVNGLLKKQDMKDTREQKPLWTSPLIFAILAAGFAGEWLLRRRIGLH